MVNFCSQYSYGSHVNGETSTGGQDFAEAGPGGGGEGGQPGGASLRAGGAAAGDAWGNARADRRGARCRASHGAAAPSQAAWAKRCGESRAAKLGGRRRALLSPEQERAFLAPWVEASKAGGVLVVSPMRAALAQQLGQPVAASVVYRLLARHGWRKVAPDTRHPKSDPKVQEDWKKNCPKHWLPC